MDFLNNLEGIVTKNGDMVTFIAEDLENKLKQTSPTMPTRPLGRFVLDANLLNDLEFEARNIAASVDTLSESLSGVLHSMSALTVDCLEIYRDVVCKTCDSIDANIKSMYQLMAKCEEVSKEMEPIYKLAQQVKDIKHILDLFENAVN
ncbi:BLOC-1-related complex subunit 6 [Myzus persicae]|uniref:BLOC-1-related complex subunit 6 n=1 Tax=Myzus persicae TaxID=13164 RepID=UPI000B936223|nr:BLOC-1-related complex subunit 6 [Myzus persicae]XP_022164647.1 BLOC-1-related complex subunit 6 [Myzus persicae]XP_022164648.1 BLOC-1-related complex subunit 6 [Myzus persicae]